MNRIFSSLQPCSRRTSIALMHEPPVADCQPRRCLTTHRAWGREEEHNAQRCPRGAWRTAVSHYREQLTHEKLRESGLLVLYVSTWPGGGVGGPENGRWRLAVLDLIDRCSHAGSESVSGGTREVSIHSNRTVSGHTLPMRTASQRYVTYARVETHRSGSSHGDRPP